MMKFQLQSVDIFRIDPVIWGAMERIFKIQTGLYNVKQTEALPMFKLPLCLFSTNHRFLFSLYPSLSCLSGEFLIHTKISGTDINVSLLLAHFSFHFPIRPRELSNSGHPRTIEWSKEAFSHSPKTRGSKSFDNKPELAFDSPGGHLASALVIPDVPNNARYTARMVMVPRV